MNRSDTTLTDQDKTLLSKGLKFIPTPPKPNSHRSLIKDFNNFTRNMRLKFLFADRNSKPHPFHVKSNWQPPPQPSVALENFLERTKYEIATISFCDTQDNLSAKEREALKKLRANTKANIKKAEKGNTTVVMDTQRKITEGSDQVYDTNYYTPVQEPIVASTANKVKLIVNKLCVNKHIDETTFNNSQNLPRIPEFYTLTKIHKPNLAPTSFDTKYNLQPLVEPCCLRVEQALLQCHGSHSYTSKGYKNEIRKVKYPIDSRCYRLLVFILRLPRYSLTFGFPWTRPSVHSPLY